MIDIAIKYADTVKELFVNTWYKEKYKYYHGSFYSTQEIPDNDHYGKDFVSLNSKKEVIGYISYNVNNSTKSVNNFGVINFSEDKFTFGKDIAQVIDDIFMKFNMNRLEFFVIVGNPIEKSYDKMINKYGGRIIGIRKQSGICFDNKLYDEKMYEILRDDYIKAKYK